MHFINETIYRFSDYPDQNITPLDAVNDGKFYTQAIFFLVQDQTLAESQMVFLSKIIGAIHSNMDETLLINFNQQILPFNYLIKNIPCDTFIFFGIDKQKMKLQVEVSNYSPLKFMKKQILFAESLDSIENSKPGKEKLWHALQQMYNIPKK